MALSGTVLLEKSAAASLTIRRYEPDDHAALLEIWATTGQTAYSPAEIAHLRRIEGDALVAEWQDERGRREVVGVVLWSHNCQKAFLWRFAVAEKHRQKGIATALLQRVESDILAAGFSHICFHVHERNAAAKQFYLKHGYQEIKPVGYWGKRFDPAVPAKI